MKIRASSLPFIRECARFESGLSTFENDKPKPFADAGTDRHSAWREVFEGREDFLKILDAEDADGVAWASDYLKCYAPTHVPLIWEESGTALFEIGGQFVELPGHPDVYSVYGKTLELFDLKWRARNYDEQMASYVWRIMEEHPEVEMARIHLLFGLAKKARTMWLDKPAVEQILTKVLTKALNKDAPFEPNDHCNWCSRHLICPAFIERANAVAAGREDWELNQYHTSKLETEEELGKAMTLARQLSKWCEAVEFHAKEKARAGVIPKGFSWGEKRGALTVKDVVTAQELSGLPPELFWQSVDVSLPTLTEKYALHNNLSEKTARADIEQRLAPVLARKPNSFVMKKLRTPSAIEDQTISKE